MKNEDIFTGEAENKVLKNIVISANPLLAGVDVLSFLPLPSGLMGPDSAVLCWFAAALLSQGVSKARAAQLWLSRATTSPSALEEIWFAPFHSSVVSRFYGVQAVSRKLFGQ